MIDSRWENGMNGWSCYYIDSGRRSLPWGAEGEITGCDGGYIYVVFDGEEQPRAMRWDEIRPC